MKKFQNLIKDKEFWKNPEKNEDQLKFYLQIQFYSNRIDSYFRQLQTQERRQLSSRENILRFNVFDRDTINFILGGDGYRFYKKS